MTIAQLIGLATLIGFVAAGIRFMVKHYLSELKPNSGSSMNDRLFRIEQRVDELYRFIIERD